MRCMFFEKIGYRILKSFIIQTKRRVIAKAYVYCKECKTIETISDFAFYDYECLCQNFEYKKDSIETYKSVYPKRSAEMDAAKNILKSNEINVRSTGYIYFEKDLNLLFNFECADCGEIYQSSLNPGNFMDNRIICPYCKGTYAHLEQSIVKMYPKAARQYYKKNRLPAEKFSALDTSVSASFKCEKCGIIHNSSLQDVIDEKCEICNRNFSKADVERHFKERFDYELIRDNNRIIDIHSKTSAFYRCSECNNRFTNTEFSYFFEGKSCPYCVGKYAIPGKTSFKALYGDIVEKYWTDGDLDSILPTNSERRKFSCSVCKGEFFNSVKEIVEMYNSGIEICPYCNNRRILPGLNSIKALYPNAMEEWDVLNNTLDPDTLGTKSSAFAYFKCPECKNLYTSTIKTKILNDKRQIKSCSFCKGYRTKKIHYF